MGLSDQIMFDPSGSVSEVHGAFSQVYREGFFNEVGDKWKRIGQI